MANIKFKTGKFQEAIDAALPLLEKSNKVQRSELSKIIGESYFNIEEYEKTQATIKLLSKLMEAEKAINSGDEWR